MYGCILHERCTICNSNPEGILDKEDFVIDWFCDKCGISWNLEDLEIEPNQEKLESLVFVLSLK